MKRDAHPLPPDKMEAEKKAKPPRDSADDGKSGGRHHDGKPGAANFEGHDSAGHNAQTGHKSGAETERTAPGISTDKKADDTK